MKVVFLVKSYHPNIGGVEKHTYRLRQELVKLGNEVDVVTVGSKTEKGVYRFKYLDLRYFGLFHIWVELIKRVMIFYRADIIHIHDVFIWVLPLRIILFWKPIITTHHGWEGVYPVPKKNIYIKKLSYFLSNQNIVVGEFVNRFYKLKCKNIIYGAVDPIKPIKKKKKIVYVGRLSPDTGLRLLLDVVGKFKGYSIEFLGDGVMRKECEKVGVVRGYVQDVSKYISDAEVCFCSGYLTILESLSSKCKVVAAYDNRLKRSYLLETPFNKWIATGSAIDEIFNNYNRITKSDLVNAQRWVNHQTWKKLALYHLSLYNDLI